jgi:hypothetical protein
MKKLLCLLFLTGIITILPAQKKIDWDMLANVEFEYDYISHLKTLYAKPTFSKKVKALENQEVVIKGYVIPMDTEGNYVLSAFPNSSCFFCGNAGPESVIDLKLKSQKASYKVDEIRTFVGTLRLSDKVDELTYILEDARNK